MNNYPIIYSQATAVVSDSETIVIFAILGFSDAPYTGPEVEVLADTPSRGIQKMTLPASMVQVSTLFDDEPVDYDRM